MLFDAASGRLRALGYLLVYNVAFILPLFVVFLLAYAGVRSEQLRTWLKSHLAATKVAMGLFFLLLGIVVLVMELS
jgi:cytochrome c biogenesis protein CcdA